MLAMAWFLLSLLRDLTCGLVVLVVISILTREGVNGLVRRASQLLRLLPGAELLIRVYLRREVRSFLRQVNVIKDDSPPGTKIMEIPERGWTEQDLTAELRSRKKAEFDPDTGKGFSAVYTMGDSRFHYVQKVFEDFEFDKHRDKDLESRQQVVKQYFRTFQHENALNPLLFPELLRFETEVVAMTANMLNGDGRVVGNVTSGGTESILVAVQTYRDRARKLMPHITSPEIVAPQTVHPGFDKAAHYFGLKVIRVPVNSHYTFDLDAYEQAITSNTILLVVSAPEYTHGIIDPVQAVSHIAVSRGLPLHVDACFGGFMLPWVEKLGYSVPLFDFRLTGVTSMSADIHKYGLGPKGASVVLYRSGDYRRYQIFACTDWIGGLYGSPIMGGTRPGGNLASSWAVIMSMGKDGYMGVAKRLMKVTQRMREGVSTVKGLMICGEPHMTAFAFTNTDQELSMFALADEMERKGWKMERAARCLHCSVLPSHSLEGADKFVNDLREAVETVKDNPSLASKGSAGVYGMAGSVPDRGIIEEFLVEFFNEIYTLH